MDWLRLSESLLLVSHVGQGSHEQVPGGRLLINFSEMLWPCDRGCLSSCSPSDYS